jgi:hypothetical protein
VIPPPQSLRPSDNVIKTFLGSTQRPIQPKFFSKNKLPDGNLTPPVVTSLSLNTSGPSAKKTKPVSVNTFPIIIYKALSQIPTMHFVCRNGLTEQGPSSFASQRTLSLLSFLIYWSTSTHQTMTLYHQCITCISRRHANNRNHI